VSITADQIIRAVTAARETYASNARALAGAGVSDLGAAELKRAGVLHLLLADEELCDMLARKLREEP
jgi:hypothetical protein